MTGPSLLGWADHLLFLVLAVAVPVRARIFGMRRLERASEEDLPRIKPGFYRRALVVQWILLAIVLVLWRWEGRSWISLGLVLRRTGGLIGVMVGVAIVLGLLLRQGRVVPRDEEALAQLRDRTRHLGRMLPTTPRERSWFFALSVTAGICEEVLYRGYLIWYLGSWAAWLMLGASLGGSPFAPHAFWLAAVASALVFGLGHSYQGRRGVLLTAVVGLFLAAVYWITRSLYAGMLIHALMDVHAGYVSYLAWRGGAEAPAGPE